MFMEKSGNEFLNLLSSAAPVPGGGGASAFVGAMGVALASMVANLTSGKKKYADVQADIDRIIKKADCLRNERTSLVEKDAEVFEPLSRAYSLPKENEAERKIKDETMESALKSACEVPLEIMQKVVEAMDLHEELAKKGTRIAVSDVGVGAAFCKSALMGASLNVFINTKLMKNRQYAEEVNQKTEAILSEGIAKADNIYRQVEAAVR